MSFTNLNDFPLPNYLTLNINTIQFTVLILGLIKFLLLQILLHRNMISTFLLAFHSQIISDDQKTTSSEQEKKVDHDVVSDDRSVSRRELELVLRSLGLFSHGDLPTKMDGEDILNLFEEREASLDEVREAFQVFDCNRDGMIDERELHKVMCALGLREGLEMENCRKMIAAFDENGDGGIDFHEFLKIMENNTST